MELILLPESVCKFYGINSITLEAYRTVISKSAVAKFRLREVEWF